MAVAATVEMKTVTYTAPDGRMYLSLLPASAPDDHIPMGVKLGPPDELMEIAGWSEEVKVRLHNELFARGIYTFALARRKRHEITAAVMAALRVDTEVIMAMLAKAEEGKAKARGR